MATSYHELYRPTTFKGVIGNNHSITSLLDVVNNKSSNAFLFSGPNGIGKTTLARITAAKFNAQVIEIDAATNSGVDHMREINELARYTMAGLPRAIIIDECHRLSGSAWDALLKVTEEPHKNLYWFFCTTEAKKVPRTIISRCTSYDLKPLRVSELIEVIEEVVDRAKLNVSDAIIELAAEHAAGSARQALTNLAKIEQLSVEQAQNVLIGAEASKGVIDLARFIMDGRGSWKKAMAIVADLKDESPEGVRIIISNYLGKVLRSANSDDDAMRMLAVLQHWTVPYASNEGITPLMVSIGRSLFTVKE